MTDIVGCTDTFDEFVQLKDQAGEDVFFEFMNNYVSDSLKKKEILRKRQAVHQA